MMDRGERVGFLLGAGASFELGMPLVSHLTEQFKTFFSASRLRRMNHSWSKHRGGFSQSVIESACHVMSRPDMHYEAVLGFLQTEQRRLGQSNEVAQDYHGLYALMVEAIYHLLLRRQVGNIHYISRAMIPFEGLLNFAQKSKPLAVFSLNHDLMLEALADRIGVEVRDGFWPSNILTISATQKLRLSAHLLTKTDLETQRLHFFPPGERGINLLKIHGALDVFACREGKDLCRLQAAERGLLGRIAPLNALNNELAPELNHAHGRATNEVMYLDQTGEIQFLRRSLLAGAQKFEPRHSQTLPQEMMKLLHGGLNSVRRLYAVGYSFGDPHVDRVVREWLEVLAERQLVIVDPRRQSVPSHFAHLLPQVSLEQVSAGAFFAAFRETPLSRSQRAEAWVRRTIRPAMERRAALRLKTPL